MDKNLKLRKAIIIAVTLIGASYSIHSKALGLGDIQVKSYLGQPLLANIKVYGIDSKMDSSCFSVNSDDTNALSQINFKLNRLANGEGVLTLTSNHAVLEPIASLTVVSNCDSTFTRQYNLLIDPNISTDTYHSGNTNYVNATNVVNDILPNDSNSQIETQAITEQPKRKSNTKKKRLAAKQQSKTSSINDVRDDGSANNQLTYPASEKKPIERPAVAQPRLTISGGSFNDTHVNRQSVKLSFDRNINTSRETNPQAYSEEAVFADELTVMNNRLAHLDKQLTSLHTQNVSLTKANKEVNAQLTETKQQNDFLRMLSFCLGGGLLASTYFFADWLRRRNAAIKEKKQQAIWENMVSEQEEAETKTKHEFKIDEDFAPVNTEKHFEVKTSDDLSEFEKTHIFNTPFANTKPAIEVTEEPTKVIDEADVFLSHGRTTLAIQLLQNHLMDKPKEAASTWIFLLDLLAKEGRKEEYEITAVEFNKHFNIQVADFSKPAVEGSSLESYERISTQLQKVWGTKEALLFLDELIYNTRLEPRMGFDKAVFEELVLLREIAQEEIKSAEVISLNDEKSSRKAKKEKTMELNLPEIEISQEFKEFGEKIEQENAQKVKNDKPVESFEFELLDIATR